jgi:hypothetical protein
MKTNSLTDYINLNQARRNVYWTCKDGKLYFKHKDRWIEEVKFNKHYPKYEYEKFNDKGNLIGKNYL